MSGRNTPTPAPAQRVAMSNAERQRKHREKRKAELLELRTGGFVSVAVAPPRDDSQALRAQLAAALQRCAEQAASLATLRAEHAPLLARMEALRLVLRALVGKFSPAIRHLARRHLQETGFIEWLDAD